MAIKQRILQKLYELENTILYAIEKGDEEANKVFRQDIQTARELCRLGLPDTAYAPYGDIYDGIIFAASQVYDESTAARREIFNLCRELWQYLVAQTETETAFKKEVVFLPFQATMWDCMESVWQAAKSDSEHVVPYVVPIPYCNRNPDGSVAEWHNDAPRLPKYVPVCDYHNIDLETMHPEVIVTCNLYDDTNIVTSVDPAYYNRTIKYYTDKLVYIPYFVLEDVQPWEDDIIKRLGHFVLHPGVTESHLTIVQSEAMREAYIKILSERTNKKERRYWKERILGLGSPKFDNLSALPEGEYLPPSWRCIIEKPNGGRKTVIFYNVGLGELLEHKFKLLDKMEAVFAEFYRRRENVALLWRPHPLFLATMKSMEPEMTERYRRIVETYKNENWGIYDDSADLHRAIRVSDGYFGGGSSVVAMFLTMKKWVLRQNYYNITYK